MELTDPGFDASILSEFRTRLIQGEAEHLLLETVLTLLQERNLLKARGTQRTDSTHILAAIRTLNRLELVGETLRYALNRLAVVDPAWLRAHMQPEWVERYGTRVENYRFPKADTECQRLASIIGADGFSLLLAAYAPDPPLEVRSAPAVEVLRQIWVQQYYGSEPVPRWRQDCDVPPPAQLIHSPYDLEARYSLKRGMAWVGYKEHMTETCDADTPHVITHVETTPATTPDDNMVETIQEALETKALLPRDHLVDCGYTDAAILVESDRHYGVNMIGPVAAAPSWQAREETGFDHSAFTIDWATRTATCPRGKQSTKWHPDRDRTGQKDCQAWEVRSACTRAKTQSRTLAVRPQLYHEALQSMRKRQTTAEFQEQYAARAGIEGTLSQGVRAFGMRREHAQQALAAASREHERLAQHREQVTRSIRAIGQASQFVALERGVRRNGKLIAADLHGHIETIRAVAHQESLRQTCLARIDKAERVVPKMQVTIEFVSGYGREQVRQLDLTPLASHSMHAHLLPSFYLERVAQTRTVSAGEPLRELAERLRAPLCESGRACAELREAQQSQLNQQAKELAEVFQRSRSKVEGRNGCLSLRNHQLRGLDLPRKRECLQAIHNFFRTRSDGTTAAERFFGRKLRCMFAAILDSVELQPAPLSPPRRP